MQSASTHLTAYFWLLMSMRPLIAAWSHLMRWAHDDLRIRAETGIEATWNKIEDAATPKR